MKSMIHYDVDENLCPNPQDWVDYYLSLIYFYVSFSSVLAFIDFVYS